MNNPLRILSNTQLAQIKANAIKCEQCNLCTGRTQVVFGTGNSYRPPIMFIGEGPGESEDIEGEPFVGPAGGLLNRLMSALGVSRQEVFIDNIVKCRPPNNRKPLPEEIKSCLPYLQKEIEIIQPQTIVCLGATAANSILSNNISIKQLRGTWHKYNNIPVRITYHPAWLLRLGGEQLLQAKDWVWDDMKAVMQYLEKNHYEAH